jgi:murein DD-endopeptidase MepM/ murein hydrolase activator NlpD
LIPMIPTVGRPKIPRLKPIAAAGWVLFLAGLLLAGWPGRSRSEPSAADPIKIKQGGAFLLPIASKDAKTTPKVRFLNKTVPVFRVPGGSEFGALIGVDLDAKPSRYDLVIDGASPPDTRVVEVVPGGFGVQELTLPDDQVFLDKPTLKRVEREKEEMLGAMAPVTGKKLWEGEFIYPVNGKSSGRFGFRRIINGEPRSPHSGEDFSVPEGTPVKATNSGKVVLVGNYFFTGNSIFVDHGLGCYSMYFHLSRIDVKKGQAVKKGAVIGKVGATGRATGPHLHWGIRLNGARVNPIAMVGLQPIIGVPSSP